MSAQPDAGWTRRVAPVDRSTAQARASYDRLARWYDLIETPLERRAHAAGLHLLHPRPGESVLEIGFGTGHTIAALRKQVGVSGLVLGVDLSWRMLQHTRRRLGTSAEAGRTTLLQGDARRLPLREATFDAVSMSFVLDLIATDDIPAVLAECRRVLHTNGRLVVVCLDLPDRPNRMTRFYLLAHRHWPRLADCRPLPVRDILTSCGFTPTLAWNSTIAGIPVTAITVTR